MEDKPMFQHDCDKCIFLGNFQDYDLYLCDQSEINFTTVIARYGDDYPAYISGLLAGKLSQDEEDPLRVAYLRAKEKGLTI